MKDVTGIMNRHMAQIQANLLSVSPGSFHSWGTTIRVRVSYGNVSRRPTEEATVGLIPVLEYSKFSATPLRKATAIRASEQRRERWPPN